MADLAHVLWPNDRLGEAIQLLSRVAGLRPRDVELPQITPQATEPGSKALGKWLEGAASLLGIEAEHVETSFTDVEKLLRHGSPALIEIEEPAGPGFIALHKRKGRGRGQLLEVLGPDHLEHRLPLEELREAYCQGIEGPNAGTVDEMLEQAGVGKRGRKNARNAILRELLGGARLARVWLLRLPSSASFFHQLAQEGLLRRLGVFVTSHIFQILLSMLAWFMVGRGALQGQLDPQWLMAWALLLLTQVPLQMLKRWTRDGFSIGLGRVLKKRLLHGALQLRPREIRHQGAGQLLGRVVESSAVGSLALGAVLLAFASLIELIFAGGVLALGAGGAFHLLLLVGWVLLTFLLGAQYYRKSLRWTEWRLDMTHELVERMVGHRTRLAQEPRDQWHRGEDEAIERYLDLSRDLDRTDLHFTLWLSRGWLLFGMAGLVPSFVTGATLTPLAVGLGGVLLASGALSTLSGTLSSVSGALIAWKQAKLMYNAATRERSQGTTSLAFTGAARTAKAGDKQTVIEADDLVFRYRDRGEPVLRSCSLSIKEGDRILLEGTSGGGKSTLCSILGGLRHPESGLVLLRGLDWQTLGPDGWRQLVASAPQFQENHILTGTLAFNLLMGRNWPPEPDDLNEAEQLCRELGLGDLLDRMPSGLLQIVGETGWRLSHGERSRVFIARALLQGADLIMLDESFAALDPENLERAMTCVLERAPSLLVVAHP